MSAALENSLSGQEEPASFVAEEPMSPLKVENDDPVQSLASPSERGGQPYDDYFTSAAPTGNYFKRYLSRRYTAQTEPEVDHLPPTAYHQAEVIKYQLQDRPSETAVERAKDYAQRVGIVFDTWPSSLGHRSDEISSGADLNTIYSWKPHVLSHEGWPTHFIQYGYDADGYPYMLTNTTGRWEERIACLGDTTIEHPPWKKQMFGKEWFISAFRSSAFALILSQLSPHQDTLSEPVSASLFLEEFIGNWSFLNLERRAFSWCETSFVYEDLDDTIQCRRGDTVVQYHTRVFSTYRCRFGTNFWDPEKPSVAIDPPTTQYRQGGTVSLPDGSPAMGFLEKRFSVALRTTTDDMNLPCFTLINISDFDDPDSWSGGSTDYNSPENWKSVGFRPCLWATGFVAFMFRIHVWCGHWSNHWSEMLDTIDSNLQVNLDTVLSVGLKELMFDESGFARSEYYFRLDQLLRISSDWIKESMENLKCLGQRIEGEYPRDSGNLIHESQRVKRAFRENWNILLSHQRSLGSQLLGRIDRKREEITSLRDGLFNATSVREATKSTELNHYVLVFTIMTIVYLPLGFVTSLFALGLFDWDNSRQWVSFVLTIVLVSFSTYALAGYLIWFVQKGERHKFGILGSYFRRGSPIRHSRHGTV